jgi:hypothetical protein
MTVTYACRHDDHRACPAAAACGCSCHGQLTFDDTIAVLQLALDLAVLDDLRNGRLLSRPDGDAA